MLLGLNVMAQTIDYSRSSLSSYERHPCDLFGLDWAASLHRQAFVLFRNELVKLKVVWTGVDLSSNPLHFSSKRSLLALLRELAIAQLTSSTTASIFD
jgi:hypothetical protein